jgi:hypothetical protein
VESEVVVAAEQHSPVEVGASAVPPMVDMVRFSPGGWAFTPGPHAPTVADGEGDPLPSGEQPLFTTEVERVSGVVEHDGLHPVGAGEGLHGADAECLAGTFDRPMPDTARQVIGGDDHPYGWGTRSEQDRFVDRRGLPEEFGERIRRELFDRARVVGDAGGPFGLFRVDESGSAASRGGGAVVDLVDHPSRQRVVVPDDPLHPIAVVDALDRPTRPQHSLTVRDAGFIQLVTHLTGTLQQLIRIESLRLIAQQLRSLSHQLRFNTRHTIKPRPDRIRRRDRDRAVEHPHADDIQPAAVQPAAAVTLSLREPTDAHGGGGIPTREP